MKIKMKPHETNGVLITFCGLDGCGKTSIINMVNEYLSRLGEKVILTKQPTNSVRKSEIFRTYMDNENHDMFEYRALSLLAASDRIQHSNQFILPELRKGSFVISDRYYYSCLANLMARGYSKDKWIYEIAKDIPKPDLSFFLDVPVELAVSRVRSRPEEKDRFIDMDLQYKLRNQYKSICKSCGGILVDSSAEIEDTFNTVWSRVTEKLKEKYINANK